MEPLFAALRGNRKETGRFVGTVTGTVSTAEFFAPENVARIVGERRTEDSGAHIVGHKR